MFISTDIGTEADGRTVETHVDVVGQGGVFVSLTIGVRGDDLYVIGGLDNGTWQTPTGYGHDGGDDDYLTQLGCGPAAMVVGY